MIDIDLVLRGHTVSGIVLVKRIITSLLTGYVNTTWTCGGITGSWRQVAYIDMTNSSHSCPDGLDMVTKESKRLCTRGLATECSSTVFQVQGMPYTSVCGRIIGYQDSSPDAFQSFSQSDTIDDHYVDGVALTYGANPRKHIWTFAADTDERFSAKCPCSNTDSMPTPQIPSWIGNDYFCDSGAGEQGYQVGMFYPDDPLWDGEGCGPTSTCCSFNSPPWFSKQLSPPTTDDIEMRVCAEVDAFNDDVPIEIIELYVL